MDARRGKLADVVDKPLGKDMHRGISLRSISVTAKAHNFTDPSQG